jgi:rod shape-determining protein MreC
MNGSQGRAVVLAIVFVALSVAGVLLHLAGLLTPAENAVLQLAIPVQRVIGDAAGGARELVTTLQSLGQLREENRRLAQEVADLQSRVVRLQEAEIENRSLREQLGFKRVYPAYDLLPAEVVGHDPSNYLQFVSIDKGSNDGVGVGAVVVVAQGLLGRVVSIGGNFSKVLLVTDVSSSVNVMLQSSRASGVASGQLGEGLTMRYIPQGEQVRLGDMVLTSGLGGNFPKGLIVGRVKQVKQKDIELFQEAQLESLIDFRRVEVAYVIRNFSPQKIE